MKDDPGEFFMAESVAEPPPKEDVPPPEPPSEPIRDNGHRRSTQSAAVPDLTLDAGLPASVDSERTILGAILLDDQAIKEAAKVINADDFSLDSHRRIFLRMAEIAQAGSAIDIVTLSHELAKNKEVESIGGVAYLASLTEGLPRRPVIGEYIRIIKDKSLLRRIMGVSSSAIARAADQSEEAINTLEFMERELLSLRESSRSLFRGRNTEPFFVGARTFISTAPENVDWTIDGIIQKEGNGLVLGDSGTSKSVLIFDLALHMVAGVAWFQHRIPKRLRVGLVAREDATGLSQGRLKKMLKGAPESVREFIGMIDLEDWLYVNTRAQRDSWTLQSNPDLVDIIESIKERKIQFVFLDVFRALWEGNENDNQETSKVLGAATRIATEANCQVCIVHHLSKSDKGTIFDRARGGGINGWKEWGLGLTVENPDDEPRNLIRKIQFHTKADAPSPPIFYRLVGGREELSLEQVDHGPPQEYTYGKDKKKKKKGEEQSSMSYNSETEAYNAPF
jgi:replicative DNA helicase